MIEETLLGRIRNCASLPSLPTIAMQVLDLAQQPEVDLQEIAKVISKDPALTAKILKTVNSSFYGRSHAVGTISHALVILGLQSVKTLVLGFSLVSNLSGKKAMSFKHVDYWKHSIFGATAAKLIAEKIGIMQQEEAFLTMLLANIGMLVLDQVLGEEYGDVVGDAKSHYEIAERERAAFKCTHAEVGGWLATSWKLPPVLTQPIEFHLDASKVSDPQVAKLANLVRVAELCADVFVDENASTSVGRARMALAEGIVLDGEVDALLKKIGEQTREMAQLFELNIGQAGDFSAVLRRANDALVEITLQSQAQATQLQETNRQLQVAAHTDKLTSLANRMKFDETIACVFSDSALSGRPLSMLLMDVDKFKSVNDTYGHPAGDAVLRAMGKLMIEMARPGDLAARVGGEEIALLLPDTDRRTAIQLAETIRLSVASRAINTGVQKLRVTISIGVATFERGVPFRQPAHLFKAADLAVYAAKHGGRNQVKAFSMPLAKAA